MAARARRQRGWLRRLFGWALKLVLIFLLVSVLWVLVYRFVPVTGEEIPLTAAGWLTLFTFPKTS